MKVFYEDKDVVACEKPVGVLSEESDKALNMPTLLREYFADAKSYVGVLHRLDKEVGGVMLFAKNKSAAADLSRQIREHIWVKEYLAIIEKAPESAQGEFVDLLFKDSKKNKSYVVKKMRRSVREASLSYRLIKSEKVNGEVLSLVKIKLHTGRSHQIRVQFASRKMPLFSDTRYAGKKRDCSIALWSYKIKFKLPSTGEGIEVLAIPPENYPWELFK